VCVCVCVCVCVFLCVYVCFDLELCDPPFCQCSYTTTSYFDGAIFIRSQFPGKFHDFLPAVDGFSGTHFQSGVQFSNNMGSGFLQPA